jgi:alpha-beta hydrolase superfamily lysophospholipase
MNVSVRNLPAATLKWTARAAAVAIAAFVLLVALRSCQLSDELDLASWHTWAPAEPDAREIDALDWTAWRRAEDALFAAVAAHMRKALEPQQRVPANRYFEGSPVNPRRFSRDWNRSYVMVPDGQPVGAVVLLHGLTDAPYSLRHIARFYVDHRYVAVGIRMPAHGTVPGALMSAHWEDWLAATRLAVREADRLAGGRPLEIVGYSNGAAVALKYALDALAEPELPQAQRLVLISPMLGLGHFARYAGIAGWPAVLHGFAKAAWIDILPEFNPFKYNSFPINGARQSYALTQTVARGFAERAEQGKLAGFPPVIAFQSVVDATVNTAGTFSGLFAHLPANGSEIVLFDVNRASRLQSLLKDAALTTVDDLLPAGPQSYRVTIIGNAPGQPAVTETTVEPGAAATHERGLGIDYPLDLFSLSHVALPFPHTDSLYGSNPRGEDFGLNLGAQPLRGERGVLIEGADPYWRATFNPFFSYMIERITESLAAREPIPDPE